jgi:hypothetical protein
MRRLLRWVGGAAGGVAAYRWLRRSPTPDAAADPTAQPQAGAPEADERVEELRAKLAENRESEEPSPVEPGEPEEAVEERRQRVHEEGRATLDEMKSDGAAPESN